MPFVKGKSGNPAGRTPGRGAVAELRAALGSSLPELLQRLVLQALTGDTTAARLILDRVVPPLKAQAATIELDLTTGTPLLDQGEAILAAVAQGLVAPDIGAALVAALGQLGALKKTDELEARIRELEGLA